MLDLLALVGRPTLSSLYKSLSINPLRAMPGSTSDGLLRMRGMKGKVKTHVTMWWLPLRLHRLLCVAPFHSSACPFVRTELAGRVSCDNRKSAHRSLSEFSGEHEDVPVALHVQRPPCWWKSNARLTCYRRLSRQPTYSSQGNTRPIKEWRLVASSYRQRKASNTAHQS